MVPPHSPPLSERFGQALHLQRFLKLLTGGAFVFVKGVGVDVQGRADLGVAQESGDGGGVGAAGDHQARRRVAEAVDVEVVREAVFAEDVLKPPREGGWRHGEARTLAAEKVVVVSNFSCRNLSI